MQSDLPDLSLCRAESPGVPADRCWRRDGWCVPFGGKSGSPEYPFRVGTYDYTRDGRFYQEHRPDELDIIRVERFENGVWSQLTPAVEPSEPASPQPVITGPGLYRTKLYDRDKNDNQLAVVVCKNPERGWLGTIRGFPYLWFDDGMTTEAERCYDITGPYVEPPKLPTIEEAARALVGAHSRAIAHEEKPGFACVDLSCYMTLVDAVKRSPGKDGE